MAILVTGGAGYIGSHMVHALADAGESVVVLDNLSTGFREAIPGGIQLFVGDTGDQNLVSAIMKACDVDAVIHFAASIVVPDSVRDPLGYYRNNTANARALIEAAVQNGVKHFIFSSTAAVYGNPADVPVTEESPTVPMSPYGTSKLMFERCLHWYHRAYGMRAVCLRYFNAAGATAEHGEDRPDETHLIPHLLDVVAGKRDAVDVFGTDYPTADGTCVRDYVHVADIARAHLAALAHIDRLGFECFNVGSESGYSVLEVLRATESVAGRPIPRRVVRRRPGDPAVLVATASKLARALDWAPRQSSLDFIISTAWQWRRRFPNGYAC
jgi:UDP-glucose 4-epimerase